MAPGLGERLRLIPVLAYAVIALSPVLLLVAYAFYEKQGYTFEPAMSTEAFAKAVEPDKRDLLGKTLLVTFVSATVATAVAYLVVYCSTVVYPRLRRLVLVCALMALFGGYLVRIFAWRTLLGQEGILASVTGTDGLFTWVGEVANTKWAVMLALVNFSIPLCILPISSAFAGMDAHLRSASRDLGAGAWETFRRVVLPQTVRGAIFAFALAFVLCAGDYVTPALLGGKDGLMFGSVIAQQFTLTANWPLGAAMAVVLMGSVLLAISIVFVLAGRATARWSGATSQRSIRRAMTS